MSQIDRSLNEWVSNHLITAQQADAILNFEKRKNSESSWVLPGLLSLGAIVVVIGIISLIASNWDLIPGWMKLVSNFSLLAVSIYCIQQAHEKQKTVVYEGLLLFYMLVTLGSIGLISQVFHTGGELYQALMLWSVMHVMTVFLSKRIFTTFLWSGIFLATFSTFYLSVYKTSRYYDFGLAEFVFQSLPLFCLLLSVAGYRFLKSENHGYSFGVYSFLSFLVALIFSEFSRSVQPVGYFVLLGVLASGSLFLIKSFNTVQRSLLIATIGLYLLHIFASMAEGLNHSIVSGMLTIAALSVSAVFLASQDFKKVFQFLLIVIGLRFLVFYFQAFGGLAQTGFGLIISGILILAMAYLWNKYRHKLAAAVEGWAK